MQELKLPKLARTVLSMFKPIPFSQGTPPPWQAWLARAAQARRIAAMLALADAKILEAYAAECEAEAGALIAEPVPPIAA